MNDDTAGAYNSSSEQIMNEELSEFVRDYCANTLNARDSWVAQIRHPRSLIHFFNTNFHSVHRRELRVRNRLQRFHNSFVEKHGCIAAWKNVSAAFFTAAAATSAGAAAATANAKKPVAAAAASAASILFGALGKWTHSLLLKEESAVEKHKDVTSAMIEGSELIIKDLAEIHALAGRMMQFDPESMAMEVDVNTILGKEADRYSGHVSRARARVHDSIIRNNCIDAIDYVRADI